MPWRMIIDQANAAAESNGRFFNETNRFAQNELVNRKLECSSQYQHNRLSGKTHP